MIKDTDEGGGSWINHHYIKEQLAYWRSKPNPPYKVPTTPGFSSPVGIFSSNPYSIRAPYKYPSTIGQDPNSATNSTDDFTGFWELNKLDAVGVRVDGSFWAPGFPFIGADINADFVYSLDRNDLTIYFTPSIVGGLGQGAAGTVGIVGYYDTPQAEDAVGPGYGGQVNLTTLGGVNLSYGYSDKPGASGFHSQTWSIAASAGGELGGSASAGYTFLWFNAGY